MRKCFCATPTASPTPISAPTSCLWAAARWRGRVIPSTASSPVLSSASPRCPKIPSTPFPTAISPPSTSSAVRSSWLTFRGFARTRFYIPRRNSASGKCPTPIRRVPRSCRKRKIPIFRSSCAAKRAGSMAISWRFSRRSRAFPSPTTKICRRIRREYSTRKRR